MPLNETFETEFLGVAYGAGFRWSVPGTKITTDSAPPDRVGKGPVYRNCQRVFPAGPELFWRTSFRDGADPPFTVRHKRGYIEGAVTGPEFGEVLVAVTAGTYDVPILVLIP